MSFRVFGDARDDSDIVALKSDGDVLTSLQRQDAMFNSGFGFEAAIARAALVEGLLLHYLLCAKQIRMIDFGPEIEKKLKAERITFGQVKDALKAASAFHDTALQADVEAYVLD